MVVCISDVHFGIGSQENILAREKLFLELLQALHHKNAKLYIVGDLFDYWFEYKTVLPKEFYKVLTALQSARENGVEIHYIIGNHDFGHQHFFENELKIPLYWEDVTVTYFGKRFLFSHGDGKAYNDTGYLILKKILRNTFLKKLYQYIHPDFGIWLAKKSSHKSRAYTDKKEYSSPSKHSEKNGLEDFAKAAIESGVSFVIMGHIHSLKSLQYLDGFYYNLGEWFGEPHCAVFTEHSHSLLPVTSFIKSIKEASTLSINGDNING